MTHKNLKKLLALLLALTMCFSLLPVPAFAEGPEDEITVEDSQDPPATDEGDEDEVCEHVPADAVSENETEPSCTAPGSHDEVVYCELCGKELSRETVEDPATGHDYEPVEAADPTCTAPGHSAGVVCTRCGDVSEGCEEIAATGHTPVDVEEVPPQVGVPGTTAGTKCAVCGEVLSGCEVIAALEGETDTEESEQSDESPQFSADIHGKTTIAGTTGFGSCGTNLSWSLDAEGVLTISGTGDMDNYYLYQQPKAPWYADRQSVQSVQIGQGVLRIGDYAFRECSNLTVVTLPTGLVSIGTGAFSKCSALTSESITLPEGLQIIGDSTFGGCTSLTGIDIPDGVQSIGQSAFGGTGLISVVIPDGVQSVGVGAFAECSNLSSVVIPASVTTISGNPFWESPLLKTAGPIGSDCDIEFGWEEAIPDKAFCISSSDFTSIESVILPDNLKTIGKWAFAGCETLAEPTIPSSVTSIGQGAFENCKSIESITIPVGVLSIATDAFRNCISLESVYLPAGLRSIGDSAFCQCSSLPGLNIPSSVTSIGDSAFCNCTVLASVEIPSKVTSIGEHAFSGCAELESITISNSVTSIGDCAFLGCSSLKSCSLPLALGKIGQRVFYACTDLEWVFIPVSVTEIGKDAFSGCTALTDVYYQGTKDQWDTLCETIYSGNNPLLDATIHYNSLRPEGGNVIPDDVYSNSISGVIDEGEGWALRWECRYNEDVDGNPCDLLLIILMDGVDTTEREKSVYSKTEEPIFPWLSEAGFDKSAYKKIAIQGTSQNPLEIIPSTFYGYSGVTQVSMSHVAAIWGNAFEGCTSLTRIAGFGSDLYAIGEYAFRNDTNLSVFALKNNAINLTIINKGAFMNTALTAFPSSGRLKKIGDQAFMNTPLASFSFGADLEEIGARAFANTQLSNVDTNNMDSLRTIGEEAFLNTLLTSFSFGANLEEIGARAFAGTDLISVTIPSSVTSIAQGTFYNCLNLTSVVLPVGVAKINCNAFNNCRSLTDVYFAGSEAKWAVLLTKIDSGNEPLTSANIHCNTVWVRVSFKGGIYKDSNILPEMEIPWSFDLLKEDAKLLESNNLAIVSLVLSANAYDRELLESTLQTMGFSHFDSGNYGSYDDINRVGYGIASAVATINGQRTNVIVVACRGSSGKFFFSQDWQSNFFQQAQGFHFAAEDLKGDLNQYIANYHIDTQLPTKLLFTGHSRGGAAANLLGTMVSHIAPDENVFVYTFACPNTTTDGNRSSYSNISNYILEGDIVPLFPLMDGGSNKFGSFKTLNTSTANYFKTSFSMLTGGVEAEILDKGPLIGGFDSDYPSGVRYHAPCTYMACLLGKTAVYASEMQALFHITYIKCPVDVEVYHKDGSLLGRIVDNVPDDSLFSHGIFVGIDHDEKYIYTSSKTDIQLKLIGTDDGTMVYGTQTVDSVTGAVIQEHVFENVTLCRGKTMTSAVGGETPVKDVRLLVVNDSDVPIREVKTDGTEILYLADPSNRPVSLSMDREYLALKQTVTAQQLSVTNLPDEWLPYLEWSSDNERAVTVDASGKLSPVDKGTAWITASVDTGEGVLSCRCRIDVVEAEEQTDPVTGDPVIDPETGEPVTHFAEGELTGVRLVDTKATTELYKSTYTRITVLPELKQNQTSAAATILAPDEPAGNNGVAVEKARFANNTLNSLFALRVVDDRTLEIVPLEAAVMNAKAVKASYKSALIVTVDGKEYPTGTLNLTVKKSLPKIKAKAVKFNSFLVADMRTISFTGAAVTEACKTSGPAWLEYNETARSATYVGARDAKQKSAKLNLAVRAEGWNVELPVAVTVSAAKSAPKLTLKPATLSLHPGAGDMATTTVTVKPSGWDCSVVSIMEGKKAAPDALEITTDGSRITVQEGPGIPTDGKAHTYKVTLALLREGSPTSVKKTLTVKLLASKTKISLGAKAAGSINTALLSSTATVTVTPKGVNAGIVAIDPSSDVTILKEKSKTLSEDVTELFELSSVSALRFTVRQRELAVLQSGYTYTAVIRTEIGGNEVSCRVKLPVKFGNFAKLKPSVTLKAKGAIDVIRPGSAVTVTPTVKNCHTYTPKADDLRIWRVQGKTMTEATEDFDVSVSGSAFRVKLKPGFAYNPTAYKYKVSLSATVQTVNGEAALNSAKVAMTVKMGKAKLTQSTKSVRLLKTDRYSMGTVTIRTADSSLAAIDWERTAASFVSPKDKQKQPLFELNHLGGGELAICYKDNRITTAKGTTVKIPVYLVGNNSAKPNATLSVKVQIA